MSIKISSFKKLSVLLAFVFIVTVVFSNLFLFSFTKNDTSRPYRVQINRAALFLEENPDQALHLSDYPLIIKAEKQHDPLTEDFFETNNDYIIKKINGSLYRFEYMTAADKTAPFVILNSVLAVIFLLGIILLLYVKNKILRPFERLSELPYEIARGNLTAPLNENKSKFFGKFIWGINLLRENTEKQKQHELQLRKEQKTLLLSLSHDIKTPLSAIKLYSKALSRELYSDKEKQLQIAGSIYEKVEEAEKYIAKIITASKEDFILPEVHNTEFYLSKVMNDVNSYYSEKLKMIGTDFCFPEYSDCIVKGDPDRCIEVLQNMIENAIKYGDGNKIEFRASQEEECVLLTVANSGCTLSEDELPYIFESFWRGKNSLNSQGSGLGLYICQQLVRRMNGEAFAEIKGNIMEVTIVLNKA